MTILEAYRALIAADFRPVQNIEFHWYSAEVGRLCIRECNLLTGQYQEGGLLGSQAIARDYEARKVPVIAMSQVSKAKFPSSTESDHFSYLVHRFSLI